jgi:hypothetical protein
MTFEYFSPGFAVAANSGSAGQPFDTSLRHSGVAPPSAAGCSQKKNSREG